MASLAAAASLYDIPAVTVPCTGAGLLHLHPPAGSWNTALVVIAAPPVPGPADFLARLRQLRGAGARIVPDPDLWDALWNSPSPHLWLQRHGLPAVPPARCADAAGTDSNPAARFLLPLVITARGDHVVLPLFTTSPRTGGYRAGESEVAGRLVSRVSGQGLSGPGQTCAAPPVLSAGIRKRSHAIAACLAQRLGTAGVFAVEYTALPEDSVHINRVLRFVDLTALMNSAAAQSSLARIHVAALFDLPLPDFTD